MKIYYLNLDRRPDRRGAMELQFERLMLDVERIASIDAIDFSDSDMPSGTRISKPEYACFLSHREAWKRFVDSGDEYALVLEDDTVLAPDLKFVLSDPEIDKFDFDLLHVETWPYQVWVDRDSRGEIGGLNVRRTHSYFYGTAAYILTRKFAKRALDEIDVPARPVDVMFLDPGWMTPRPNVLQLDPAPVTQECFISSRQIKQQDDSDIRLPTQYHYQDTMKEQPAWDRLKETPTYKKLKWTITCVRFWLDGSVVLRPIAYSGETDTQSAPVSMEQGKADAN